MDVKDRKILFELCKNSRMPLSRLAKNVGLSREVVEYRLKRLLDTGVIKKKHAIVNASIFGFYSYTVFLFLKNVKKVDSIVSHLKENSAVRWLASCIGKYDLTLRITVRNQQEFDRIFSSICDYIGDDLLSFEIMSGIRKLKAVTPVELFFSREAKKIVARSIELNDSDLNILKLLSLDSRTSLIDIANEIKLTPEAAKYRVRRLEKSGVISSYSCTLDIGKLGFSWYTLIFSLKHLSKTDEASLKMLLQMNKKSWFAEKGLGQYNLLLELIADSTEDFHKTLADLRDKLSSHLLAYELLLITEEHKNEIFPDYLLEQMKSNFY